MLVVPSLPAQHKIQLVILFISDAAKVVEAGVQGPYNTPSQILHSTNLYNYQLKYNSQPSDEECRGGGSYRH